MDDTAMRKWGNYQTVISWSFFFLLTIRREKHKRSGSWLFALSSFFFFFLLYIWTFFFFFFVAVASTNERPSFTFYKTGISSVLIEIFLLLPPKPARPRHRASNGTHNSARNPPHGSLPGRSGLQRVLASSSRAVARPRASSIVGHQQTKISIIDQGENELNLNITQMPPDESRQPGGKFNEEIQIRPAAANRQHPSCWRNWVLRGRGNTWSSVSNLMEISSPNC